VSKLLEQSLDKSGSGLPLECKRSRQVRSVCGWKAPKFSGKHTCASILNAIVFIINCTTCHAITCVEVLHTFDWLLPYQLQESSSTMKRLGSSW
jgi:hypothetical protein